MALMIARRRQPSRAIFRKRSPHCASCACTKTAACLLIHSATAGGASLFADVTAAACLFEHPIEGDLRDPQQLADPNCWYLSASSRLVGGVSAHAEFSTSFRHVIDNAFV